MNKILKYAAILVGTILVVIILALVAARLYFTDERILSTLKPPLEKKLNRDLEIRTASLSFWGGLGVKLEDVTVGNAPGFYRPYLLHLGALDVKVRFWPLLSGEVVLDRMIVGPGEVYLEQDSVGNNWSSIAKPDTSLIPPIPDSVLPGVPRIPVAGMVQFREVTTSYDDYRDSIVIRLEEISGQVEITPEETGAAATISGKLSVTDGQYRQGGTVIGLTALAPECSFAMRADFKQQEIDISSLVLRLAGIPVSAPGTVNFTDSIPSYVFGVEVEPVALAEVFQHIPDSLWAGVFVDGPPDGEVSADLEIRSAPMPETFPVIDGKVLLTGIRGVVGEKKIPFEAGGIDIRCNETVVSLTALSASVAGVLVSVNLTVDQFDDPNFSARLRSEITVAEIKEKIPTDIPADIGGTVSLDLSSFGAVKNWRSAQVNGPIELTHVSWMPYDTTAVSLDDVNGTLRFAGEDLVLEKLQIVSSPSRMTFNGHLEDLVPFLIPQSEQPPPLPRLVFTLASPYLDVDALMAGPDTAAPPILLTDMTAEGTFQIDTLHYNAATSTDVAGTVHYADRQLLITDIQGTAYDGQVTGTATVELQDISAPEFSLDVNGDAMEANAFLSDFTGFSDHLFGTIDLSGTFGGKGTEVLDVVRSLTAKGEVSMSSGRFEAFGPLTRLAEQTGFAGIKDSGPIKDLHAWFWIEDGRLYTRDWEFVSSGAEYNVLGSVGFDGSLDYHVSVTLPTESGTGNLLSQLGNMLGVGGGATLDFTLQGTYDNPKIALDSKSGRKRLEKALREKAQSIFNEQR